MSRKQVPVPDPINHRRIVHLLLPPSASAKLKHTFSAFISAFRKRLNGGRA